MHTEMGTIILLCTHVLQQDVLARYDPRKKGTPTLEVSFKYHIYHIIYHICHIINIISFKMQLIRANALRRE